MDFNVATNSMTSCFYREQLSYSGKSESFLPKVHAFFATRAYAAVAFPAAVLELSAYALTHSADVVISATKFDFKKASENLSEVVKSVLAVAYMLFACVVGVVSPSKANELMTPAADGADDGAAGAAGAADGAAAAPAPAPAPAPAHLGGGGGGDGGGSDGARTPAQDGRGSAASGVEE